ncbi:MAG: tyrosine--tRNA ligase [Patescibacteria group bacterium]|nr:tyrosine--tRNA ligase [Patescibacteria group bacterium]
MESKQEQIDRLLSRNVESVIEKEHLRKALESGKKLRVKLGIDPTSPDLHLGHAVVLQKLKEFQDLGHQIVLIIGDFTARIGDPTGRSQARKPLSEREIKANEKEYLKQAGLIINIKKAEIYHNSGWFLKEGVNGLFALTAAGTMQQMLHRGDFKERLAAGGDVTVTELLYPLLQGYDSVKVRADAELGGNDQLLNLLAGRRVQRHFGMEEQDVLTTPLLEGLDGKKKMSKSYGNYIGLTDAPEDMFGKTMSIPDQLVEKYFLFCTELPDAEIKLSQKEMGPKEFKEQLGFELVKLYHGEKAAHAARERFEMLFSKKEIPDDIPELRIPGGKLSALDLVAASGAAKSKSDARRLIEQGGVELAGKTLKNPLEVLSIKGGEVVKVGKKRFFKMAISKK